MFLLEVVDLGADEISPTSSTTAGGFGNATASTSNPTRSSGISFSFYCIMLIHTHNLNCLLISLLSAELSIDIFHST